MDLIDKHYLDLVTNPPVHICITFSDAFEGYESLLGEGGVCLGELLGLGRALIGYLERDRCRNWDRNRESRILRQLRRQN